MRKLSSLIFLLGFPSLLAADPPLGYYRQPTIHAETIVFCAEGDLWKVPLEGGVARRLTTHPAEESGPAISPDGETVGFAAAYEGPTEIYVMPLAGGLPTRLTYEGGSGRRRPAVAGWTPEGRLLYTTRAYSTLPSYQLVAVDPDSGARTRVPLAQAADGSYDPSGETLYFTRQAFQGSHAKRYRGGTAKNLWKLSAGTPEAVPLTADYPGTSKEPMWWDGRVYFASDRDGTMNLWSMDAGGGDLARHTSHDGWDVKSPSLADGRVVYQLGADLRLFDVRSGTDRGLGITLASDFDQLRERWIEKPMDYLTAAYPSPDGDRVVLTARGEVFVAPVGDGRFVHVTRKPGVRYRQARFLPDGHRPPGGNEGGGRWLMALSDESGEVEWWKLPASGVGAPEPLTTDGKVLRYDGVPSPDGRWIAHRDHDRELWLSSVETRESRKIASSPSWGISAMSWSPDSRWLAYSLFESHQMARIHVHNVGDSSAAPVTTERYHSFSPVWSPDGQWIYFLSDRHFQSLVRAPWGQRQPDPFFDRQTKIYAVALAPEARFPFQPGDELQPKKKPEDGEKAEEKPEPVDIVLEGLTRRLREVPVPPGTYRGLAVTNGRLYWLRRATDFERKQDLMVLAVGPRDAKPKTLVKEVEDYELSMDGKKLLIHKGQDFYVADAKAEAPLKLEDKVDLSNWTFPLDPREEWRQMFVDSWRLHRDYFYDRQMHGLDWPAMLEKYLPLLDRVTTRAELSDLQAQMVSELSVLHTSVRGGDHREGTDEIQTASLGAVLERDEAAGGYRVAHVYRSDPDLPDELGPLARPGVEVGEGDVIVAINGVPTLDERPEALLRNQAGKQVRLRAKPAAGTEARDVIVTPIDGRRAYDLRYDEWEYTRRLRVEESGGGEIGYVHLRAMSSRNIAEWQREFYPVFDRQGLIVDVRHNSGGNIDSWILGKLLRRAWFYWQGRSGEPYWNMQQAFRGHMVVLVNEWTSSDGEAFAEGFRRLGLGPVIGTRTWGGEIWLSSSNVLVDKGIATAAETGVYGPEGVWLIEGHGVDPDVVVDNLPHATFQGEDAQLEKAIEVLREKIRQDPRPVPPAPPYPDKSERK